MQIVLINQFFWPDLVATSVLLTDFSRHLTEQGHEVTVLCGATAYAGADSTPCPDVRVVRIGTSTFRRGAIARILSYASFFVGSLWTLLRIGRPDVVITMTTPPLISVLGALLKRFRGVRHYVWEMDMYPEVAVDLGLLPAHSWITRLLGAFADWGRTNSDLIVALGDCMKDRLLARGVPADRVAIAENWADGDLFRPVSRLRETGCLTIAYAGNLGLGHDAETLATAMLSLREEVKLQFVFVGGGAQMKWLKTFCTRERLERVTFLPYATRNELNELMRQADIGLVTQKPSCVGSIVPSKFYSLAALGLPILYIGPESATPGKLISKYGCGWSMAPGDSDSLRSTLLQLIEHPAAVSVAGARALEAFRDNWDRSVGVRRLANIMNLHEAHSRSTIEPRVPTDANEPFSVTSL